MSIRYVKWLAAIAAACILQACSSKKEGTDAENGDGKIHFEVSADVPDTKTSITASEKPGEPGKYIYTPMWGSDDAVAVLFSDNPASTPAEELSNSKPAGEKALFTGDISAPSEGSASVIYPYSAWTGGKSGFATLKAAQTPSLTSFDPSCDILCAEPAAYSASSGSASLSGLIFHRLTGVLRIELTGSYAAGNHIRSLKLTAPEGTALAGNFTIDLENPGINTVSSGSNVVTATYPEGPEIGSGSVFLSLLPCVIAKNSQLSIEVRTESFDIVRTITLREDMVIPQGGIAVLRLSVTEAHCTSLRDREGWTTTQVCPGLKWHNFEGVEPVSAKPQIVNVLEADLNNSGLHLSFVYSATDKKVSEIAAATKAIAATNATYGQSQEGVVYIKTDGVVRRTIDFTADGYTAWKHKAAVWYDGARSFGFYNFHSSNKEASNNAYIADTHPNLFSSAPLLIDNGSHAVLSGFSDGTNVAQIHPRTVLAVTGSGRLLLITIDGRMSTAKGMTCAEMQDFLDRYFAPLYAINMDGGGSTAMYIDGSGIVNYPCDGTDKDAEDVARDHTAERSIPTFFVISQQAQAQIDPSAEEQDNSEWYQIR